MDKVKLNDRMFRILFNDGKSLLVDVNSDDWEGIFDQKEKIIKIESDKWIWNLLTGEIVFH